MLCVINYTCKKEALILGVNHTNLWFILQSCQGYRLHSIDFMNRNQKETIADGDNTGICLKGLKDHEKLQLIYQSRFKLCTFRIQNITGTPANAQCVAHMAQIQKTYQCSDCVLSLSFIKWCQSNSTRIFIQFLAVQEETQLTGSNISYTSVIQNEENEGLKPY